MSPSTPLRWFALTTLVLLLATPSAAQERRCDATQAIRYACCVPGFCSIVGRPSRSQLHKVRTPVSLSDGPSPYATACQPQRELEGRELLVVAQPVDRATGEHVIIHSDRLRKNASQNATVREMAQAQICSCTFYRAEAARRVCVSN